MFCLIQDDDGHWYIIPANKRKAWHKWLCSPEMPYTDLPEWAESIGCDPAMITFPSYKRG